MDYYAILGIASDAEAEAIRHAFRTLARRHHPDSGEDPSAEKFRSVREAYETLINPGRRQVYDRSLRVAPRRIPVRVEPTRTAQERSFRTSVPPRNRGFVEPLPSTSAEDPFRNFGRFDRVVEDLFDSLGRDFFFHPRFFRW